MTAADCAVSPPTWDIYTASTKSQYTSFETPQLNIWIQAKTSEKHSQSTEYEFWWSFATFMHHKKSLNSCWMDCHEINLLYSQNHEHVFPNKDLQC